MQREMSPEKKIYSDLDMESIHGLAITQPHKDVDQYIFDNSQSFESIIVSPPTIYGISKGPFIRQSQQIPLLIRGFIKYGKPATIGKGINIWNHVHVDDLADFYFLLLEKALKGEASTGKDGWYFCESGEHYLKDLVAKIGEELFKRNAIQQAEVVEFKPEEVDVYLSHHAWWSIGANSRSRAERARALGWKPSSKKQSAFESIGPEVETILAAEQAKK